MLVPVTLVLTWRLMRRILVKTVYLILKMSGLLAVYERRGRARRTSLATGRRLSNTAGPLGPSQKRPSNGCRPLIKTNGFGPTSGPLARGNWSTRDKLLEEKAGSVALLVEPDSWASCLAAKGQGSINRLWPLIDKRRQKHLHLA